MRPLPVESDPDETVRINGVALRVRDLPRAAAAMYGYGHVLPPGDQWREVTPAAWPYRPETCRRAGGLWPGAWLFGGTVLVCTGCGLDVT